MKFILVYCLVGILTIAEKAPAESNKSEIDQELVCKHMLEKRDEIAASVEKRKNGASVKDPAQGCVDQVTTSFSRCFAASNHPALSKINGDEQIDSTVSIPGKVRAEYERGKKINLAYAKICKEESFLVSKICESATDGLKEANRNNSDHQISLDLQVALRATQSLTRDGANALKSAATCFNAQATLFASAQESIYTDDSGNEKLAANPTDAEREAERKKEQKSEFAPAGEAAEKAVVTKNAEKAIESGAERIPAAFPKLAEKVSAYSGTAAKVVGPVVGYGYVAKSIKNGEYIEAAIGFVATTVEVAVPRLANLATGLEVVTLTVGNPTPAGTCSEIYSDPVLANEKHCPLSQLTLADEKQRSVEILKDAQ